MSLGVQGAGGSEFYSLYTQGLAPINDVDGTAVVKAGYIKKREDGKTFTWYNSYNSSSNHYQLNITNCTYYYFGIS